MQNYVAALLSNITYLKTEDYALTTDGKLNIFNIEESGISSSDLSFFNENFTIEFQKNGTEGFSVMKIIAVKSSEFSGINSGDVTLAFRGTEMVLDDWITDVGMAIKAVSDMVPKIITEGSQYIPGLIGMLRKLGNLSIWNDYFKSQSQQALDYFNIEKELNNNITIVGHSLGGYLANYVTTTGDNYNYIKETRTFNAPGFNTSTMVMIELRKRLDEIINSNTSNLTGDDIILIKNEIDDLSIKILNNPFNPNSFQKLNPFYAENGPELTSNDIVMFMPDSVNKIPMFITPQLIPTSTHGIGLLVRSSALYDTLSIFMTGSLIDNYKKITKLLEAFESHPLKNNTIESVTRYISNFLGFSTNISSVIFDYISNLTSENLNKYIYNEITISNYKDSSAHLYALFNFIPFSISTNEENSVFKNTNFDINLYTEQNINERFNLFEKYQNLMTPTISNATLKNLNIYENYKIIYEEDDSNSYIIFDEYNKTVLTNDSRSFASSMGIGDFTFYGDSFSNIETIYLKNNQSTLFVNTLNNKVYDTYLDDYIILNKGETILDLSYGNDTINIDVSNGATLKDITIKDNGMGDLFIFNGSNNSDIVQGTQYNDKIIGAAGEDHLFGGDGDDFINGGIDNDMIFGGNGNDTLIGDDGNDYLMGGAGSNSLDGGAGDDTLNIYNTPTEYHDIRGDSLNGGTGFNKLFGTGYGDTYNYGGGVDTIYESDKHFGINYVDKLVFKSTTQASQVSLYNILNNLVIAINGLNKIFVIDYYNNNYSYLDEIHFINNISGDKIIWDTNYILNHTINRNDGVFSNVINGTSNNDNITGTSKDDYIDAGDGADTVNGSDGNDLIYGGSGNDILNGGAGNDTIYGEDDSDNIDGGTGNDEIHGGNGNDTITGSSGNDIIYGDYGDDIIVGGGTIQGEVDTIYGGDGNDTINQGQTYTNDIVFGGKGNDNIFGNVGADKYHYTLGDGKDTITESSSNSAYIDSLYLHGVSPDNVDLLRKNGNFNDIYIIFKDNDEYIIIKNYYQSLSTTNYLDEIIFDNGVVWKKSEIMEKAKRYYGSDTVDVITVPSNSLQQDIYGQDGNDVINNSSAGTVIYGGLGNDNITSNNNNVSINGDEGIDTIKVTGTNITINAGTGNDNITLSSGKEILNYKLNDGKDTINTTGAGGDVYNIIGYNKIDLSNIVLSGKGKILELKFNDNDSLTLTNYINVLANINNSMTFNFDDGSLTNNELKDLYTIINKAETLDNTFYDTIFSDQITGTDADDTINIINGNGGSGFDTIFSGNGIDTITNKIDNTVIKAGNDGDIIYTYGKNVTINGDAGNDKIYISSTYIGSGYLGGDEGDDTFTFLSNSSSLNNYIIEGGLGNDTINMSKGIETIIFNRGDGEDTINISGSNTSTQTDKLILRGYSKNIITADNFILYDQSKSVTLKLNENDSINMVKLLAGTVASNNLKYFEFDDGILTIEELIEKITKIKGTDGNDTIFDTSFSDTIDLSGNGIDNVYLKSGNDYLTTGYQSTRVTVQSSNNIINSGSGNDTFFNESSNINTINLKSYGNGHDIISFGYLGKQSIVYVNVDATINIADTSVDGTGYKFSWGNDSSIYVAKTYVNAQVVFNYKNINYEDINLVGDDSDNYLKALTSIGQTIYGNGGNDTIYGSINDDIIYGGIGNDKLYGESGNDKIHGESGDDNIQDMYGNNVIYGGDGKDTIYTGSGNDIIYGGDDDDTINSGSGIDIVYGGDGNDTITGGGINSEFYGGNGNDSYYVSSGTISDYSGVNSLYFGTHYTAKVKLENTLTGFNVIVNDEQKISYNGNVNRIERSVIPPDGYKYRTSLVGNEISRLFELQAALETETDTSKISSINSQISNLWKYDQP